MTILNFKIVFSFIFVYKLIYYSLINQNFLKSISIIFRHNYTNLMNDEIMKYILGNKIFKSLLKYYFIKNEFENSCSENKTMWK